MPPDDMLICGLALGYEDTDAVPNQLRTTRVPVEGFATFHEA